MADLSTNLIVDAGTKPTFVAATASDTGVIGSGHNTFAVYRNGSASSKTVTVIAPGTTDYGQLNPDPAIVIAASAEAWIPLRGDYDPGDGTARATLTTSAQDVALLVAIVKVL